MVGTRYGAFVILLLFVAAYAHARDPDGKYAQANPKLHEWFKGLSSAKGPCCADADGALVQDADWESKDGHYRVRIEGSWVDVPDDAVIKEPNRDGRTIVWGYPTRGWSANATGYIIRCFMPGAFS
jgi:hypothetical protein